MTKAFHILWAKVRVRTVHLLVTVHVYTIRGFLCSHGQIKAILQSITWKNLHFL